MSILVRRDGKEVKKLGALEITQEDALQEYIHDHPDVIPLDDIREDLKLLVLAREFPTLSGPIDALAIDDEGAIYIIETKLYKNPDKRHVVAQVLDYGAGLWSGSAEASSTQELLDREIIRTSGVPMQEKLQEYFAMDEDQVTSILSRFYRDMEAGRFTFIVLMDKLHDRLKDLISYINANSPIVLVGCELDIYRQDDLDIIIPRLYGTEARGKGTSAGSRRKWSEDEFFDVVNEQLEPEHGECIREVFDFAKEHSSRISWGTGALHGSFNPKFDRISQRSVFTVYSNGELRFNFQWLTGKGTPHPISGPLINSLKKDTPLLFPKGSEDSFVDFPIEEWYGSTQAIIKALAQHVK